MKKSLFLTAALVALILVFTHALPLKARAEAEYAEQYVVTACGKAEADIDCATLSVGVESYALCMAESETANAEAAKKVIEAFAPYGETKETYFSAYPAYDKEGYIANRTMQCVTKQTDKVTEIIQVLSKAGVSRFCGVYYGASDIKTAEQTALKNARENAAAKAAALADNLKLVQIREFSCYTCSENNNGKIAIEACIEAVYAK